MVTGCGCGQTQCVCYIEGDDGIDFTGNGSGRQPYRPTFTQWDLVGIENDQADVNVTGAGTSGNPWVVTITTQGGSIVQTIYESDDTWEKPDAGTIAQVVVIGGGGGGGTAANTNVDAGGSGGAGGAMSVAWFPLDDLPDEVDIEVGDGGAGGRPIAGLTSAGNGGDSWFGSHLYAPGGRGGTSQSNPNQIQHTTWGGTPSEGGPGGAGAIRLPGAGPGVPATAHERYLSPTGGGVGEGAATPSSDGGLLLPGLTWAGRGGDGGDYLNGGDGLPGAAYGGGGGGGQSLIGGNQDKVGGNGAQGVVVVTVW